ncbi:MAG: Uma2 family endonuclease [Cyanothece sp. SIO2G6]|nr:Uma2 family endonuclease [Cyanothece sp. SIO2G6]
MVAIPTKLTFHDFLEQYPDGKGRFELVKGDLVEMPATRRHDDIAEFLDRQFYQEVTRLDLNYVVKQGIPIRTQTRDNVEQGRIPDVSVINKTLWRSNRTDYAALREPIQLAVEVVSTNWEDDYIDKFDEYQRLGIFEYWIVDYLGLGAIRYLGKPKQPTVFVHWLGEGTEYQVGQFRSGDRIISPTFPELNLTVQQILAV